MDGKGLKEDSERNGQTACAKKKEGQNCPRERIGAKEDANTYSAGLREGGETSPKQKKTGRLPTRAGNTRPEAKRGERGGKMVKNQEKWNKKNKTTELPPVEQGVGKSTKPTGGAGMALKTKKKKTAKQHKRDFVCSNEYSGGSGNSEHA